MNAEQRKRRAENRRKTIERAKAEGKNVALVVAHPSNRDHKRGPKPSEAVAKRKRQAAAKKTKKTTLKTCGDYDGRTRTGQRCKRQAGHNTEHLGTGRCSLHGGDDPRKRKRGVEKANGRLPSDRGHEVVDKAAPKNLNDAKQLLGIPIEMDPMNALMWCIRITAGEIQWYSDRMAELKEHEWIEDTFVGKQLHMYARNRTVAIDRLAKYSKWAVDSGIAERAMRLAESYGEQLYVLLHGVLEDLDLSPQQRRLAPEVIRRHLMAMEKKNVNNSPNQLVSGADPDTIVIEDAEVVES